MNALRPDGSRCFFFSRSVHAKTRKWSATSASEIHIFSPVRTYRSPFLTAVGLDAAHVAAGRRLGEPVAGDLPALRLRDEVALLLILGAPREQRQAVEPGVHRHDHAQRRVHVLELLAGEAEADVVHAGAAVLRRHRDAEQAELRHLRQDRSRSNRCSRSSSRMCGATSRAAHSRTDCSSRRCSSVRSKLIMAAANAITRGGRPARARRVRAPVARPRSCRWPQSRDGRCCRTARRPRRAPRRHRWTPPATPDAIRCGSRALRPPSLSNVRRSMFVIRLPNRSIRTTSPVSPSSAAATRGKSSRWKGPGRAAERGDVHALGQPRRRRREAIATFERAAHRRPRVPALGQLDDALRRMLVAARRSGRRCRARRTCSRRCRPRCRAAPSRRRDRRPRGRRAGGKYR